MRSIIIITILLCSLVAGQAQAVELTVEQQMAHWISFVCDTEVSSNDVTSLGEQEGWEYFYSPYNKACQYTAGVSNVWKMNSDAFDKFK